MAETDKDKDVLGPFFEAARATAPAPSVDLLARVLADAEAVQNAQALPGTTRMPARRAPSLWRQLAEAVGGWPALAGLTAAGVAGLWIGLNPPGVLSTGALSGLGVAVTSTVEEDLVNMLPGFDLAALEEG